MWSSDLICALVETSQIAGLLRPYLRRELDPAQLEQVRAYLDLLLRWNARTNLTAVRDERNIVLRHFAESLFAAHHLLEPESKATVVDLGSGAGFPGLPLKISSPGISLTLIESQNKKATFLKEVVRALNLEAVQVYCGRAESWNGEGDLVTLRAVERFESIVPVAASLVRAAPQPRRAATSEPGSSDNPSSGVGRVAFGRLGLLIGQSQIKSALELLPQFNWESPAHIPGSSSRVVLVGYKKQQA